MEKAVRVLQFTIGGPEFTGVASFLHQYYQKMDHSKVHCDFLFCRQNSMALVMDDPTFAQSQFYILNAVHGKGNAVHYGLLGRGLKRVLKQGAYDVLHINTHRVGVTLLCVCVAKMAGVKTIVSHSHNVRMTMPGKTAGEGILRKVSKAVCGMLIRSSCSYLFACSENAGKALFGAKGTRQENFHVLKNAIDSRKYIFSDEERKSIREKENVVSDCFVVGQVGRLSLQKNQLFSIEVFARIREKVPNARLWLIGSGNDREKVEEAARANNILEYVHFLGERNDVPALMKGMDAFIFPSVYEGLGIVAIEAQAAGLPVYASTAVPKETQITKLIHYLELDDGAAKWAEYMVDGCRSQPRENTQSAIVESGYDISSAAKWLEDFYVSCQVK